MKEERIKKILTPNSKEKFSVICFSSIGQGSSFCTAINCKVGHREPKRISMPGKHFYVKATQANRDFFEPVISAYIFDDSVLNDWLKQTNSLEDWVSQFRVANAEKYEGDVTVE